MTKFLWGKVIDRFNYDFDGEVMSVRLRAQLEHLTEEKNDTRGSC